MTPRERKDLPLILAAFAVVAVVIVGVVGFRLAQSSGLF
jgi:hypothetical protein